MKNLICVLLSTYNGIKYLKQQLDSLLQQTVGFDLYIWDDGSSDGTLDLIRNLKLDDPIKVHFIGYAANEGYGYPKCFLKLLEMTEKYDYYFWCDQDDVWENTKIETMTKLMKKQEASSPIVLYHRFNYCDENLNVTGTSAVFKSAITPVNSMFDLKEGFGFATAFNDKMRTIILQYQNEIITSGRRDWWIIMLGTVYGKVYYHDEILAQYRRHSNAVTSAGTKQGIKKIQYQMKQFVNKENGLYRIYTDIELFKRSCKPMISKADLAALELFTEKGNRLKKVLFKKRLRLKKRDEFLFRCLFLLKG